MSVVQEPEVKWTPDQMVEVILNEPDDFLKVRETLTSIGVASRKEKKNEGEIEHSVKMTFSYKFACLSKKSKCMMTDKNDQLGTLKMIDHYAI